MSRGNINNINLLLNVFIYFIFIIGVNSFVLKYGNNRFIKTITSYKNLNARSVSSSSISSPSSSSSIDLNGDGSIIKTIIESSKKSSPQGLVTGDIVAIEYTTYINDSGKILAKSSQEQLVVNDGSMIKGWDIAINSMKVGEKAEYIINSEFAYGNIGINNVVLPNSDIKLVIKILAWLGNSLTPESLFSKDLDIDPFVSSTPEAIQADYDEMSLNKDKDGKYEGSIIDIYLRRLRNISFGFGGSNFFASQSGEAPPWYLNPNLTFPSMIAICLGAFIAVIFTGSVKEKGEVPITDNIELSSIIRMDYRNNIYHNNNNNNNNNMFG